MVFQKIFGSASVSGFFVSAASLAAVFSVCAFYGWILGLSAEETCAGSLFLSGAFFWIAIFIGRR